jgi:Domain of unknown function (DUF4136)
MKKLRTTLNLMSLVLPVLFVISCATPAYVEKDESTDFSRYHSFAWVDKSGKEKKNEFMDKHVKEAVAEKLKKEGWKEDSKSPDVLLSYDLLVEKTSKEQNNPVYSQPYSRVFYNPYTRRYGRIFYPSSFLGYDNNTYTQNEGTLTLTMLDADSDKTIWQGWTTDEVNSRNVTKKEIESSVKSIFRKFDVVANK